MHVHRPLPQIAAESTVRAAQTSSTPFPRQSGQAGQSGCQVTVTVRPSSRGGFVASAVVNGVKVESSPRSNESTARADLRLLLRQRGVAA